MKELMVGDLVRFSDLQFRRLDPRSKNPIMIVIKYIDSSEAGTLVEVFSQYKTYIYPTYLLEKII